MSDILPCPFCGNPPTVEYLASLHQIWCSEIGCAVVEVSETTIEEAAARWNRRTPSLPSTEHDHG